MTPNASRAPVDFDAFERELQQPAPQSAQAAAKGDPLAELARIVGQDDPFRALLQVRDARAASHQQAQGGRIEPTFYEDARYEDTRNEHARHEHALYDDRRAEGSGGHPHQPPAHALQAQAPEGHAPQDPAAGYGHGQPYDPAYGHPPDLSPADAFNQYLASVEQGGYDAQGNPRSHGADDAGHAFADDGAAPRNAAAEKPRQRSRLVSVGAGLAVLVVSVTGALTWRSLHTSGNGGSEGVPTIMADKAPLKIAPKTADGVEIPDQNKQIYDRTAKDGQIRIVNREEQPVDVAQAARAAPRPAESAATPATATPGTLNESLGEPRRVRTVSVKPDTPPPAQQRDVPAQAADTTPGAASTSVIPSMVMPGAGNDGTATTASLRPRSPKIPPAVPAPEAGTTTTAEAQPAPAQKPKPAQKVAALPAETAPAAAVPVTSGPVGGFSVQLGVRTSQAEAQAAFRQMQTKYSQLNGQPPLIRQAEVNGKSIFRVRVGPLGKDEANSLCSQIQGAGGQCFVAKN
ncbi:hypothetical protein ASG40_13360 [Methylobacterium sp. Leaf399]|uniref:SPOR domain-containing protein n=1 Tax=Methylobacterium sp. Leaf399 TaxID=1736364 RepID=UPI0006FA0C9C|nr:SPOR domain-containing protein [Methylobacterium sp. Leaf399]KQT07883.1 hypothetical protein ASG40_13360 [Methylobacterium sp. Leaf399]